MKKNKIKNQNKGRIKRKMTQKKKENLNKNRAKEVLLKSQMMLFLNLHKK